jgi:putative transposase
VSTSRAVTVRLRRPLKADTPDDPDRALRAWLRDYARRHARWGYRRAYVDARRDGWQVNHKKIQRLWAEEGLRVVVKRRRKRIGVSTIPAMVAEKAGDVWSVDFQFDSTITGKPVKILSIVDEHTRECLGGVVDYSITGLDLAEQLDVLAIDRGMPQALRMDNGPELISNAVAQWASETDRVFIPPGQPWRNGYVESFNGKLRDECLNVNQFTHSTMLEASSASGRRNTTPSGRIHPWGIRPRAFMLVNAPTKNQWRLSKRLDLKQGAGHSPSNQATRALPFTD